MNLNVLASSIAEKIGPMLRDIVSRHAENIHSIHIVGSAVMPDYNEKRSDINSVLVLHTMDLKFLTFLAPLGKKYGKKRVAAPLVMTPDYVHQSLDAFPIEFLDFKLIHQTVAGEDILAALDIRKSTLRLQCEREIKIKLMGLRQGYIASLGKRENLAPVLVRSITGSMAFFRSIIHLLGKEPPVLRAEVVKALGETTTGNVDIFEKLLALKTGAIKPSEQELGILFTEHYHALESIEKIIDNFPG